MSDGLRETATVQMVLDSGAFSVRCSARRVSEGRRVEKLARPNGAKYIDDPPFDVYADRIAVSQRKERVVDETNRIESIPIRGFAQPECGRQDGATAKQIHDQADNYHDCPSSESASLLQHLVSVPFHFVRVWRNIGSGPDYQGSIEGGKQRDGLQRALSVVAVVLQKAVRQAHHGEYDFQDHVASVASVTADNCCHH